MNLHHNTIRQQTSLGNGLHNKQPPTNAHTVMERARSRSSCIYAAIALRPRHVQRARSKHVSLGNSCIERIRCRLTALSMLTVRRVVLERSQLIIYNLIVCEFGGFKNVLRDAY